jgi:type I restriction enzyme S subunit
MSNSLPQGWTAALLDEVTHDVRSGFASGKKNVHGGLSHLRMNNIGIGGELVLDLVRAVPPGLAKPHYLLNPGDVLVCTTNSTKLVGKCAFFDLIGRYVFSNHLTRLRPVSQLVDGKFLRGNLWVLWKSGYFDEKCKNWSISLLCRKKTY